MSDLGPLLRQIGEQQFDRVVDGIAGHPDRDTGVHEARKALKRLRALLRLARPALPRQPWRDLDRRLRDLGRLLSPLRDARVSLDTLDALAPGRCPMLRERLGQRYERAAAALVPGLLHGPLESARWAWADLLKGAAPDSTAGVRRVHRRGRRRYATVVEHGRPGDFHEWRKQVKHLRYGLEALQEAGRTGLSPAIEHLTALGEVLGEEHDLTVVIGLVEQETDCGERAAVAEVLGRHRHRLQEAAVPLGDRSFGTGADAFAQTIWAG